MAKNTGTVQLTGEEGSGQPHGWVQISERGVKKVCWALSSGVQEAVRTK